MPLLCEMTLDEQKAYTESVWSNIHIDPTSAGVGCPHCHSITCVPTGFDTQIAICDECGKSFTVTRSKVGPRKMDFYYATL